MSIPPINYLDQCKDLLRATPNISEDWILDKSFVCAGGEEGKDVCEGDGGGPLVCKHKTKNKYVFKVFTQGVLFLHGSLTTQFSN